MELVTRVQVETQPSALSSLKDAETGQRGDILTEHASDLVRLVDLRGASDYTLRGTSPRSPLFRIDTVQPRFGLSFEWPAP